MSITLNIDCSKIDKAYLKQGKYLDMRLMPYKDGKNDKNQDGMVAQTIPKALKAELGLDDKAKGPIIGNYTDWDAEGLPKTNAGWGEKIKPAKAFQNREKPAPKQDIWGGDDLDDGPIPF
jgi:hypothetical protein